MGQGLELLDPFCVLVEFSPTILPRGRFRSGDGRGALSLKEVLRQLFFLRSRPTLKGDFVKLFNPLLSRSQRLDFNPVEKIGSLLHHKWAVHQEEGLLRDGCRKTLRAGGIGTGKIK